MKVPPSWPKHLPKASTLEVRISTTEFCGNTNTQTLPGGLGRSPRRFGETSWVMSNPHKHLQGKHHWQEKHIYYLAKGLNLMLITQTLAKWRGTFVLWGSSWGAAVGLHWAGGQSIPGELAVKAEEASFTLTAWTPLRSFLSTRPWPLPGYPRLPHHSKINSLEISHWSVSLPRKHSYLSTNAATSCSTPS